MVIKSLELCTYYCTEVQAREAEMKHMTKNVSRILQHKLVYPQENGGNLSFDDAERLLAALSSKDSARQELKVPCALARLFWTGSRRTVKIANTATPLILSVKD